MTSHKDSSYQFRCDISPKNFWETEYYIDMYKLTYKNGFLYIILRESHAKMHCERTGTENRYI